MSMRVELRKPVPSCKPNARVDQQIYVYADRDIEPGEEITADYRTFKLISRDV